MVRSVYVWSALAVNSALQSLRYHSIMPITTPPRILVADDHAMMRDGMVLMIRSRYKLIGDQQSLVRGLLRRLNRDPLLPAADIAEAERIVTEFNIDKRVTAARRSMVSLGLVACLVAVAAAVWVIWIYSPSTTATPTGPSTTSTTGP